MRFATCPANRVFHRHLRLFGLTDNERGEVKLTDLGRRIADPAQEAAARLDQSIPLSLSVSLVPNETGTPARPISDTERQLRTFRTITATYVPGSED